MRTNLKSAVALCSTLIYFCSGTSANDSAASTALGGIQLRREPRVAMVKERLMISVRKVTVEYEFVNDSDRDVTTEIAFPIPPYSLDFSAAGIRPFDDFRVWVEEREVKYETEARATMESHDYSETLRTLGVDIATLGHYDDSVQEPFSADFRRLSKEGQGQLIKAGLFDPENNFPQWTVEKFYHWNQTFPARKVLHVRHEYKPGVGFMPVGTKFLDKSERNRELADIQQNRQYAVQSFLEDAGQIDNACIDPKLERILTAVGRTPPKTTDESYDYLFMKWVDYILTTANSWKTPIQDFELIVEKPATKGSPSYVSFCWDGPVERIDARRFRARVNNFIPRKELHIAFFSKPGSML